MPGTTKCVDRLKVVNGFKYLWRLITLGGYFVEEVSSLTEKARAGDFLFSTTDVSEALHVSSGNIE